MFKQTVRWLDPILLIGLFFSTAIGVAMVLIGNDSISSLIIGLLSTIVTLLIDIVARIVKAEKTFLDAIDLTHVLSEERMAGAIREIANNVRSIEKYDFEHYDMLARLFIDECRSKLREITSGCISVPSRSVQSYGMLGIKQAKIDIRAIHTIGTDYWGSDFGRRSFEMNKAALKRGVRITRIFALNPDEIKNSIEALTEQFKCGINTIIVDRKYINREFVIFDSRIAIDFDILSKENPSIELEQIILDPRQVKIRTDEFQNLITRYGRTLKEISPTII